MTKSNKLFFLFFCVLALALVVSAQQKSITVSNLVPDQYNLFFNPFDQDIPLTVFSYDGDPYQWNTNAQAWGDAETLTSGQGIAMIPKTSTAAFSGTNFKTQIDVKSGFNTIGSITDKAILINDLVIVENNNLPMQSSIDGFYNIIYKYNPTLGYLDFEQTDKMEPGKTYFI